MQSDAREQLRELMSEISEDCWCAAWLNGLEYSLWAMVKGADRKFGMDEVRKHEVDELRRLSAECGGWWVWSEANGEEVFAPMAEWLGMYTKACGDAARTGGEVGEKANG